MTEKGDHQAPHSSTSTSLVPRQPGHEVTRPQGPGDQSWFSYVPPDLDAEKMMGLRDYLAIVRSHRWLVVAIFLLFFGGMATYTLLSPSVYKSSAVIQVVQVLKRAGFALGPKMYSHPSAFVHGQMMLLASDSLFDEFAQNIDASQWPKKDLKAPTRFERLQHYISALYGDASQEQTRRSELNEKQAATRELIARHLHGNLRVEKVDDGIQNGGNMIQLTLEAHDPKTARSLLASYVSYYLDRNLEQVKSEIDAARAGLRRQLASAEEKLMGAEKELIEFTNEHGLASKTQSGIERLLGSLNKSLERLQETQEQKQRFGQGGPTAGPRAAHGPVAGHGDDPLVNKLKEDIASLELEHAKMVSLYSPRYPRAVQTKKRIQILREKLKEAQDQAASRALAAAKKEEAVIKTTLDETKKQVERANVLETRHTLLKKRVETARKSYEEILTALNEAEVKWGAAVNNVALMQKPRLNPSRVSPNVPKNLLLGALMGLVAAIGSALVVEHFQSDSVDSPIQVMTELSSPVLGTVPDCSTLPAPARRRLTDKSFEFAAYDVPNSPMADSINCVLTSVGLTHPNSSLRSLAVSSSLPGEGKTMVAISVASKIHSGGSKRTLLVDADMRRPRLHKVFGQAEAGMGLSSILSGEDVTLHDAVQYHRIPGLCYMTAGPLVADPVSLLRSERLALLCRQMQQEFDYIVFDCPPMLGLPDVPIICNYVAGIMLVARQSHVKKGELRRSITIASSLADTEFLGIIMNRVSENAKDYAYGYGAYGSYYSKYYSNYGGGGRA